MNTWRDQPIEEIIHPTKATRLREAYPHLKLETLGDLEQLQFHEMLRVKAFGLGTLNKVKNAMFEGRGLDERHAAKDKRSIVQSRGSDQFMLRLPSGLRDELRASAEAAGRSMNTEMIARLELPAISIRDYLAGSALNGLIPDCGLTAIEMAERCYEVADAMLEVRSR